MDDFLSLLDARKGRKPTKQELRKKDRLTTSAETGVLEHTITATTTFAGLELAYGVTVRVILQANGLTSDRVMPMVGTVHTLPGGTPGSAAASDVETETQVRCTLMAQTGLSMPEATFLLGECGGVLEHALRMHANQVAWEAGEAEELVELPRNERRKLD